MYLSHLSSIKGGVAILFAKSFLPISCEIKQMVPARLLFLQAKFEKNNFVFLNLYAPTNSTERIAFFKNVSVLLQSCNPDDYLLCGGGGG